MNFFEAQERARKSSQRLIIGFVFAVLGVIGLIYLAVLVIWQCNSANPHGLYYETQWSGLRWWAPEIFGWVSVVVGGTIGCGSLVKHSQLSAGGAVVARDLEGRRVEPSTTEFSEQRLVNVVEEMAIAAGLPVPGVWIMDDEKSINAFAAGTDPTNAVIGVTRGALEKLNRAELQGVIAHEFSHILNGDMKLNMRLMAWIYGLVMISMLGRKMLRILEYARPSRDSKDGGWVIIVVVIGVVIWLSGSIGVLFARMLQAGISRQREFLADASAVQFTRDAEGIANALKKVGGMHDKGTIRSANAAEARHLFFVNSSLSAWMATHPPLKVRIKAIQPSWDGGGVSVQELSAEDEDFSQLEEFASGRVQAREIGEAEGFDPQVGVEIREQLRAGTVASISKREAKHLLLGFLISPDSGNEDREWGAGVQISFQEVMAWNEVLNGFDAPKKLAAVDLALPSLRGMGRVEATEFVSLLQNFIRRDGEVSLFEFMLQQVIERHVVIGLGLKRVPATRFRKLEQLDTQIGMLLGMFVQLAGDEGAIEQARREYREHTGRELPVQQASLAVIAKLLPEVDAATPLVKQQVLRLCGHVVMADGQVTEYETTLLRAVAEAIGTSLPPRLRLR